MTGEQNFYFFFFSLCCFYNTEKKKIINDKWKYIFLMTIKKKKEEEVECCLSVTFFFSFVYDITMQLYNKVSEILKRIYCHVFSSIEKISFLYVDDHEKLNKKIF